jgi:hypothetical protein
MSCNHPRTSPELPCPWPACPEGTPQQTVVLLHGSEATVTARRDVNIKIESDEGAELYRRKQTGAGWEWEKA